MQDVGQHDTVIGGLYDFDGWLGQRSAFVSL